MKLSKAIQGFALAKLAEGCSEDTFKGYRWALDRLTTFLQDPDVESITVEDLRRFNAWLRTDYKPSRRSGDTSPLSNVSLYKVWASFRSFFNWASPELGLENRPDASLERPKFTPKAIAPFTADEIRKLLKAAEYTAMAKTERRAPWSYKRPTALRDLALVYLLLDTGLRVSECARLRIKDVNLETGEVHVRAHRSGHKSRDRLVYLGKTARKAVWRYLSRRGEMRDDDYLFLTIERRPMNRNSIRLLLTHIGKRAGIKGVHPQRFRHTFAISYLRNGGDVFTLKRLLGHGSLTMVQHYLQLAEADIAEAHRHASPVDRLYL